MPLLLDDVIERDELLNGETFFVQCMSHGFVGVARKGSELEKRCQARADSGKLDAYILHGGDECPECRREEERDWRFYVENVRPFDEPEDRIDEAPWVQRAKQREAAANDRALDAMMADNEDGEELYFSLDDAARLRFDQAFHSNDRDEQIQKLATEFGVKYSVAMACACMC